MNSSSRLEPCVSLLNCTVSGSPSVAHPSQQTSLALGLTGWQPGVIKTLTFFFFGFHQRISKIASITVCNWLHYPGPPHSLSARFQLQEVTRFGYSSAGAGFNFAPERGAVPEGNATLLLKPGISFKHLGRKRQLQNPVATQIQRCQLRVLSCVFWPTEPALCLAASVLLESGCCRKLSPCIGRSRGM